MIRKFAQEGDEPTLLITGCYAQLDAEPLQHIAQRVVVVSLDDKPSLLSLPAYLAAHIGQIDPYDALKEFANLRRGSHSPLITSDQFHLPQSRFLKIQDGCDNSCITAVSR